MAHRSLQFFNSPTSDRLTIATPKRFSPFALLVSLLILGLVAGASWGQNPAADGFNATESDAKAVELADRAMESMGGRQAWDNTRYISWTFFGMRNHVWDKWSGIDRFENGDTVVILNVNSKEGKAWKAGAEVEGEELAKLLQQGYEAWVNDSYWLVMPYKLKDSGVTLKYVGEGETEEGAAADIVQMTFQDVGVTPENKYHIFMDKESGMVEQWSFFAKADDEAPRFTTPWGNWQPHGAVKLSDNRGSGQFGKAIANIRVHTEVPEGAFDGPAKVEFSE